MLTSRADGFCLSLSSHIDLGDVRTTPFCMDSLAGLRVSLSISTANRVVYLDLTARGEGIWLVRQFAPLTAVDEVV